MYPIVNTVKKAWIQGRHLPILFVTNYATLLDESYETESLAVLFEMMKHGATVGMAPSNLGGDGGLYVYE